MAGKSSSSENDPLDLSSIKSCITGNLRALQSDILDHLVLLLQCANEDNQIQSIHTAVDRINELYLRAQPEDTYGEFCSDDPEAYDAAAFLFILWSLLAITARMIPYSHPKQELLVNFLKTLRRKKAGIASIWLWEHQMWGDLPLIYPCLSEEWHPPTKDGNIPSLEESSGWLNLNTFGARLKREGLMHGTLLAITRLCDALEKEITVREVANCDISVASQWIIKSGLELYREARNGGPLDDDPAMKYTGPLYKGKPGLCVERWLFWKSRFSEVTDEVDEDVAKMAQQALGEMEGVEKVMKKRALNLSAGEIDNRP